MSLLLLYLLLPQASATSFSGLTSLPVVRNDLVLRYRVLTDRELNAAVVAGRAGSGSLRPVHRQRGFTSWPARPALSADGWP